MVTRRLAVVLKNPSDDAQFLLVRQPRPPNFGDQDYDYDSYSDSDLWDLPSAAPLNPLGAGAPTEPQTFVRFAALWYTAIFLERFDLNSSLRLVLEQAGLELADVGEWWFRNSQEEAEFGPGSAIDVVFIEGRSLSPSINLQEFCKWASVESCRDLLLNVKPGSDRIGPLAVIGVVNEWFPPSLRTPSAIRYQEYPPGVMVVPMRSNTEKPFRTTNLVVFPPKYSSQECKDGTSVTCGDALIVDPGCWFNFKEKDQLRRIVAALPRKLVVFLTHHHRDHVDGLSLIQQCNGEAILYAHKNTLSRLQKDDWSLGYTSVSGGEEICVGGHRFSIIFAPGYTDAHLALLHKDTNSLIVGDHCMGDGSSFLDINSGGNIADYYQSTYKLMDISPHVLIPMHGRVNLWPKHMLCGYLKNHRSREDDILKAIEGGAEALFDIVAEVYAGVDRSYWLMASANVRAHVDHLAQLEKLPKDFSMHKFQRSCGARFCLRWWLSYSCHGLLSWFPKPRESSALITAGILAAFASGYMVKSKLISSTEKNKREKRQADFLIRMVGMQ